GGFGGDDRAQDAARAEQRIAIRKQRNDREVDALQPRCRPLDVAVVDGQHDGAAGGGIERAGQPVLHAPVELVAALEEEAGCLLRLIGKVALTFLVGFRHGGPRVLAVWLPLTYPQAACVSLGLVWTAGYGAAH